MREARTIFLLLLFASRSQTTLAEDGKTSTEPLPILNLPGSLTDPAAIDYRRLPALSGKLAIINPVSLGPHARTPDQIDMLDLRLNLHNYLIRHDGRFWCIWSDGPKVEDWPTQEIKYATSEDGFHWTPAQSITGTPDEPYAYIARGLWLREGELLALAAHYRGHGAFGVQNEKQLELVAYRFDPASGKWAFKARLYENAINNFPPEKLPSGDWIVTRRDSRFNVSMLIGGRTALENWETFPVVRIDQLKGFRPDEPIFWPLADGTLSALFRDNGGSQRLFHSLSRDQGRTWQTPRLTNFPNATSKLFSLKTSRGDRVLVLNANPEQGRRELHLAVSRDGMTFTRLARLAIPSSPSLPQEVSRIKQKFNAGIASLQYPHIVEHEGKLLIAFSRGKVQTEVFHVELDEVETLYKE
jgi:hypothetical protein